MQNKKTANEEGRYRSAIIDGIEARIQQLEYRQDHLDICGAYYETMWKSLEFEIRKLSEEFRVIAEG